MSREKAVSWLNDGNELFVGSPDGPVPTQVVKADVPYIRTVANGAWSDNLLALPEC